MIASLLLALAPLQAEELAFAEGDLAALSVRIVAVEEALDGGLGSLARLEVRNRGALAAEPLCFEARLAEQLPGPVRCRRVDPGWHGRAGRPVAAGGRRVYPLLVPLPPKEARALELSVVEASFFPGDVEGEGEPPVEAMRFEVTRAFDPELQRTMRRTAVSLRNTSAFDVDAVFRAQATWPVDGVTLLRRRVPAGATDAWTIDALPTSPTNLVYGAEVTRLELVDWCALRDDGAERATELLRVAWESWRGGIEGEAPFSGRFAFEREKGVPWTAQGEFTVDASGAVSTTTDEPLDATRQSDLARFADMALRELRRPPFERLVAEGRPTLSRLGEPAVVRLERAPFWELPQPVFVGLSRGRIAWTSTEAEPGPPHTRWVTRAAPGGWELLARVDRSGFQERPTTEERFEWERAGERLLLTTYSWRFEIEGFDSVETARFTFQQLGAGGTALAPPSGPLADALRAAWDAPYRYPEEPAVVSGRFALENPGTGAEWLGLRRVEGTFALRGLRAGHWPPAEIAIEAPALTPAQRGQLADVVAGRFQMWASCDLAARPSFNAAFAGAEIEEEGDALAIRGGLVARVEVERGFPLRIVFAGPFDRQYVYARVAGQRVPKRVRTGEEELRATWKRIAEGWLLPVDVELRDVFEDWGPEQLTLSELELR